MKKITNDLTGKKFGKLTVLGFAGIRERQKGRRRTLWKCQCSCGKIKTLTRSSLAVTQSCGCEKLKYANRETRLYKRYYSTYKSDAKTKNREFSLDFDTFVNLTKQTCFYCGSEPSKVFIDKDRGDPLSDTTIKCNGIDRVNSLKGYSISNVVPCCHTCNLMKRNMNTDAFLEKIEKIYRYNFENIPQKIKPIPTSVILGVKE
jgi:hypothetical protein